MGSRILTEKQRNSERKEKKQERTMRGKVGLNI
jgi:hypothetical protein